MKPAALTRRATVSTAWAVVSGVATGWALAWPFTQQALQAPALGLLYGAPVAWLQWLALLLLAWVLWCERTWRARAWLGWCHGVAVMLASVGWLTHAMHDVAGLPQPLAWLAWLLLSAALALQPALALGPLLHAAWGQRPGPWRSALGLAAALTLSEWMRATWFTGFAWGGLAVPVLDTLLASAGPWLGVLGLVPVMAGGAGLMACAWGQRRPGVLAVGAMLLVLANWPSVPVGVDRLTQSQGKVLVNLLQPAVAQQDKFGAGTLVRATTVLEQALAQSVPGALLIAPETVLPGLPRAWPKDTAPRLRAALNRQQGALWFGAPLPSADGGYRNSLWAWRAGEAGTMRYDKHHLVPFGEYIPPGFAWFVQAMRMPLAGFVAGDPLPPPWQWQGLRWAIQICYEDLFALSLAQRQWHEPAQVWVNASNLAWFGDGIALPQHLNMARWRSLELGRWTVRATNTGATAVIDHRGQVRAQLPHGVAGRLTYRVPGRDSVTPFVRWAGAWGQWLWWMAPVLILVVLIGTRQRR
ncbi:MAG: apolipoprotein N-acyltransferase [Burkholderiaceae bacterium]